MRALPETDPIEVDDIQFGGDTCGQQCVLLNITVIQTVCAIAATGC